MIQKGIYAFRVNSLQFNTVKVLGGGGGGLVCFVSSKGKLVFLTYFREGASTGKRTKLNIL